LNQVAAIKKSDQKAFVEVYHQLHQKLFYFFLKRTRQQETAKELTQQCFIKLWQSRHTLSEEFTIDIQCFTIAGSVLVDHLRKMASERRRHELITEESKENNISFTYANREFESMDYLQAVAGNLPPVRRNIFMLKMLKGYSNKEIAEQLSISVKTVEDHYSKALRQCKVYGL
jgi:RNA polymerase sigma factor (sigma-70 family)